MSEIEIIYVIIGYLLTVVSLTILSKTSIYYVNKWEAWVPFLNQFLYCKIISDKYDLNLERNLLICFGLAFGSFILFILASGSFLGTLLLIGFYIFLLAISVILLIATYYLIQNIVPYAKIILTLCIICNIASVYIGFLALVQPIVILICSILTLQQYKSDEMIISQKERNERKYREELERERYY